jgi:hypothetical protein
VEHQTPVTTFDASSTADLRPASQQLSANMNFNRRITAHKHYHAIQRRTFLGLQRPPAPKSSMMGYLVVQGLAVVLCADLAFATLTDDRTTIRAVAQTAGIWKDPPAFDEAHSVKKDVK